MKPGWLMVVIPTLLSSQLSPPNRVLPSLPQTIHKLLPSTNAEAGAVVGVEAAAEATTEVGAAAEEVPDVADSLGTPQETATMLQFVGQTFNDMLTSLPSQPVRNIIAGAKVHIGVKSREPVPGKTSGLQRILIENLTSLTKT